MNHRPSQSRSTLSRSHAVLSRAGGLEIVRFRTASVIRTSLDTLNRALRRHLYPPAHWRGGSAAGAQRRRTGWGDYAGSAFAAPPTPDPSPPRASARGGGEQE